MDIVIVDDQPSARTMLRHIVQDIGPQLDVYDFGEPDTALAWFCQTLSAPILEALRGRYKALMGVDHQMAIFPVEPVLLEKVLYPLHQAKVAFVLGHELGCIALSGMVAEMLATLRFQISPFGSGQQALSKGRQTRLFGRDFEEMEHSRRLGLLELLGLIDLATGDEFKELSSIRNRYLHRLSHPHKEMSDDARRAYELAVGLAFKILGIGLKDRRATIAPEVLAYIRSSQPAAGGSPPSPAAPA